MLIRRIYKDGRCDYVEILRAGDTQNFSTRLVAGALQEGWMEMINGKIIVKSQPENLVYKIVKEPGYYCCHDGKKLEDAIMAKNYVESNFSGVPSPDPNNPAGYMKINHYECVLEQSKSTPGFWDKVKGFFNG